MDRARDAGWKREPGEQRMHGAGVRCDGNGVGHKSDDYGRHHVQRGVCRYEEHVHADVRQCGNADRLVDGRHLDDSVVRVFVPPSARSVKHMFESFSSMRTLLYLALFSPALLSAVNSVTVGPGPATSILIGTKLYVGNYNSNTVSIIDTTNNTVIGTIPVGMSPDFATLIGTKLYVNNSGGNTVSVIDTSTDTLKTTI